jgi:Na+-transporting NADH:ubiquinone oxidoreductase subunit C
MATPPTVRWLLPLGLAAVPAYHAVYAVQYMTVAEAQHTAFSQASSFVPMALSEADLKRASTGDASSPPGWSPKIWQAMAGEMPLGWVAVDQVIGKTEAITFAVAIDSHGTVKSVEILEYRESHGGEVRLPAWRRQFVGKRAKDAIRLDTDIRNISGATLSCRHVTDGVRRLVRLADRVLRSESR